MPTTRSGQDTGAASTGDKHKLEEHNSPVPKSRKTEDGSNATKTEQSDDEPPAKPADDSHDHQPPSNFLEKGIIYFFTRGRVEIEDPKKLDDIARSYMILRPIPADADLSSPAALDAATTCCLLAIPKKTLPQRGGERWIAFVEKNDASVASLKETFLAGSEYETKTAGTRHVPPATPVGEGVYALTTTEQGSHLAYILTIPEALGELQKVMGLKERGSFIVSTRNPAFPAPPSARIAGQAEYPKEVQDEFGSKRWIGTLPKHLDYAQTTILLVGEKSGIEKAMEPSEEAAKEGPTEEPIEEMEELERDDIERIKNLSQDDSTALFADLEARAKDYPKLKTTF